MCEDEKPITFEYIYIIAPENEEAELRATLKKHEKAWSW